MPVTVRFFAAARAAAGVREVVVTAPTGATIADVLTAFCADLPALVPVVARCSFLRNAVAAPGDTPLADGDSIDVLPPFAGG